MKFKRSEPVCLCLSLWGMYISRECVCVFLCVCVFSVHIECIYGVMEYVHTEKMCSFM